MPRMRIGCGRMVSLIAPPPAPTKVRMAAMPKRPNGRNGHAWVVYILAPVAGARGFRGASDPVYRRIAYGIVALAALASMPVFDSVLH